MSLLFWEALFIRKEGIKMDVNDLMQYLLTPTAQVAIIISLAEIIKRAGCPTRWIPLVDLALGLISGVCVYGITMQYGIARGILLGIALALSACGLFSGIKNVITPEPEDNV